MLLSDFPVLFKADLIFKDFSRKPSKEFLAIRRAISLKETFVFILLK